MKKKLHLGCGAIVKAGWINMDIETKNPLVFEFDLRRQLPFPENDIDFIYSEHFLEHLTREDGTQLFKECYRVLKPGGVLRCSTPDLAILVDDWADGKLDRICRDVWAPKTNAQMFNEAMRLWGHQFIYDWTEIMLLVKETGFRSNLEEQDYGVSDHEELRLAEERPDCGEVLIFEATK